MTFIEKLEQKTNSIKSTLRAIPEITGQVDALEQFLPKLEALGPILEKLGNLDQRTSDLEILQAIGPRLELLDKALQRLKNIEATQPIEKLEPHHPVRQDHDFNRLRMLSRFSALVGKAKEIEQEWQRIQQDEHDAFFAFQVFRGNSKDEYAYKKGIADGIKWCVERFS